MSPVGQKITFGAVVAVVVLCSCFCATHQSQYHHHNQHHAAAAAAALWYDAAPHYVKHHGSPTLDHNYHRAQSSSPAALSSSQHTASAAAAAAAAAAATVDALQSLPVTALLIANHNEYNGGQQYNSYHRAPPASIYTPTPLPSPPPQLPFVPLAPSQSLLSLNPGAAAAPKTPLAVMVDLNNRLAFAVLNAHTEPHSVRRHRAQNFAYSPCGLTSVLIALWEGVAETGGGYEIYRVMRLPWDRDVVRAGVRDMHRRLRTYFYADENLLDGLSLSRDNVTIRPEYEAVLRYYGYDLSASKAAADEEMMVNQATSTTTFYVASTTLTTTTPAATPTTKATTTSTPTLTTNDRPMVTNIEARTPATTSTEMPMTTIRAVTATAVTLPTTTYAKRPTTTTEPPANESVPTSTVLAVEETTFSAPMTTTEELRSEMATETEAAPATTTIATTTIAATTPTSTTAEPTTTSSTTTTTTSPPTTEQPTTITDEAPAITTTPSPTTTEQPTTITEAPVITTTPYIPLITRGPAIATTTLAPATTSPQLPATTEYVTTRTSREFSTTPTIDEVVLSTTALAIDNEEIPSSTTEEAITTTATDVPDYEMDSTVLDNDDESATTTDDPTTTEIPNDARLRQARFRSAATFVTPLINRMARKMLTTIPTPSTTTPTSKRVKKFLDIPWFELMFPLHGKQQQQSQPSSPQQSHQYQTYGAPTHDFITKLRPQSSPAQFYATPHPPFTMYKPPAQFAKHDNSDQAQQQTHHHHDYHSDNFLPTGGLLFDFPHHHQQQQHQQQQPPSSSHSHMPQSLDGYSFSAYADVPDTNSNNRYAAAVAEMQQNQQEAAAAAADANNDLQQLPFHIDRRLTVTAPFRVLTASLRLGYSTALQASVLELPLDSPNYTLLLLLPDAAFDLNGLMQRMVAAHRPVAPTVREIRAAMRRFWIRATVPLVQLKGSAVLTEDLMKLGVKDIFEPARADFKPMTDETGIYAKHIEQLITLNIQTAAATAPTTPTTTTASNGGPNNQSGSEGNLFNPIEVNVQQPFVFCIVDTQIDLIIMMGQIVNPLSSRIL